MSKDEYVETVASMVQGHMKQENYVQALDVLEKVRQQNFAPQDSIKMLLLKVYIRTWI